MLKWRGHAFQSFSFDGSPRAWVGLIPNTPKQISFPEFSLNSLHEPIQLSFRFPWVNLSTSFQEEARIYVVYDNRSRCWCKLIEKHHKKCSYFKTSIFTYDVCMALIDSSFLEVSFLSFAPSILESLQLELSTWCLFLYKNSCSRWSRGAHDYV